jgi:hypothetical protein
MTGFSSGAVIGVALQPLQPMLGVNGNDNGSHAYMVTGPAGQQNCPFNTADGFPNVAAIAFK